MYSGQDQADAVLRSRKEGTGTFQEKIDEIDDPNAFCHCWGCERGTWGRISSKNSNYKQKIAKKLSFSSFIFGDFVLK